MSQQAPKKRSSQQIGAAHEAAVRRLLTQWGVHYIPKQRCQTALGSILTLDFLVSGTADRPAVVLECKDFGVEAANPEDSKRRKTQEALWLLVQLRRHCTETKDARLVLVTGANCLNREQENLLRAELGPDFHIVSVSEDTILKQLVSGSAPTAASQTTGA